MSATGYCHSESPSAFQMEELAGRATELQQLNTACVVYQIYLFASRVHCFFGRSVTSSGASALVQMKRFVRRSILGPACGRSCAPAKPWICCWTQAQHGGTCFTLARTKKVVASHRIQLCRPSQLLSVSHVSHLIAVVLARWTATPSRRPWDIAVVSIVGYLV